MIAAKAFDPVVGVDIHFIQPPGPVPPIPIPHPFIGLLIDPMDFAPIIGATVMVNGVPRATAGTGGKAVPPHFPIGGVFIKPPGNECEVFMGSSTVLADGDPLSRLGMPALSCHDIGMPAPPRPKKKKSAAKSLFLPTSVVLAIPMGAPVLVGGPPTISMMALGMKAAMAGLGKAFKKLRKVQRVSRKLKAVSQRLRTSAKRLMNKLGIPPSVQNRVNRALCTVTGHPVDVATGKVFTDAVDLEIAGPIPVRWERVWYSSSVYVGPLGHGWHHSYDLGLVADEAAVAVRLADGRGVSFPAPGPEEPSFDEAEGLTLTRDLEGYALLDRRGLLHRFAPVGRGAEQSLVRIDGPGGAHLRFLYDATGRLTRVVDATGDVITLEWNAQGRIAAVLARDRDNATATYVAARYEYDAQDDLVAAYDALGQPFRFQYERHLLVREVDRRGYSFFFRYDGDEHTPRCIATWGEDGVFAVRLTYEHDRTLATFDDGGAWTYVHDGRGVVTELIDPYGGARRYVIDERDRVVQEIDPRGEGTTLQYDTAGELTARVNGAGHTMPAADGGAFDPNAYDLPETAAEWELGAMLVAPTGEGPDPRILSQIPASTRERVVRAHASEGAPGAPRDRLDLLGRLIERQYPDASFEAWAYDPADNVVAYRDRDGSVTRRTYGSRNLLATEVDPLGHVTRFEYSKSAELTRVVDPGGTDVAFTLDLKDRNTGVRTNDRLTDSYRYDAADNVVERLGGDGRSLVRYQIGLGNVDAQRIADGVVQNFQYDGDGRVIVAEAPGVITNFAFDETGAQAADLRDGVGVVHTTDAEGAQLETSCLTVFTTRYAREVGDIVITDPTGADQRFTVGWEGEVLKRLSNGVSELSRYDAEGRCVQKLTWRTDGDRVVREQRYLYTPHGDLREVRDDVRGSTRYEYDSAHRLRRETRSDGRTFDYRFDDAGNLLQQPGLSGVLVRAANHLAHANGDAFTYDDRGHVASRDGHGGAIRYHYDGVDLLTRVEIGQDAWEATYDPFCRRISKTWRGQTARYWWDNFRLAAELGSDGRFRVYVYPDREALVPFMFVEYANMTAAPNGGRRYFIATNHIGVPVRVDDDEGRPVWAVEVDPFGRANVTLDTDIDMPLRFPGHYFDGETGLHCNRFRYYSPELGRYLQADPLGFEASVNVYAYPPNPLVQVDIDGLAKCGGKPKAATKIKGKKGPKKKLKPAATPLPKRVRAGRAAYEREVRGLTRRADELAKKGVAKEQIARTLHAERRALGVKYKDVTPEPLRTQIYQRNIERYGDPLGPSIDYLRGRDKSWDDIIEGACRPGGKDLFGKSAG